MHGGRSRWFAVVRRGAALGCCGLLILVGCNSDPRGKYYPVEGKIALADGTPCPPGQVTFVPIQEEPNAPSFPPSEGAIREDGSYTVFTNGKPGAPLGKYRVTLAPGADKKAWSSRVPRGFAKQKRSTLEVEVVPNKPAGGYDLKLPSR